ncbi:MAG: RNA ligase (ATP) [Bacteroidota bacterium]
MERKLASIQTVSDIQPIEGADLIEVATVRGWKLVVKKNEYKSGDLAIYCEIDSFLPIRPEYEFLRKSSHKKMGDVEGFRLRTVKLRGQVSQGLLLPMETLIGRADIIDLSVISEGDDVTQALGIVKYEPPIPAQLAGVMRGVFPSFIPKTDEERVQNLTDIYEALVAKGDRYYTTEKLDGSSVTYYHNEGLFGVCSRNLDLLETPENSLWKVARTLDMERKLSVLGNFALQGELIGEGVQGNPYKLRGQTVKFFNCFNINTQCYLPYNLFKSIIDTMGLESVPVLEDAYRLPPSIDVLLQQAEGRSCLSPQAEREGIIIRSHDRSVSFKVISNKFLLKETA